MHRFNINQKQFSDILNLKNNVFYPLKSFVNKREFNNILTKTKFKKFYFPFPIYFGISNKDYLSIKNKNSLQLYYKNNPLISIKSFKIYTIDKTKFGKKIYGEKFRENPHFIDFNNNCDYFLTFNLNNKKKIKHNQKHFISPRDFKSKIKIKKKFLASFHTRNVPHLAHQWIHQKLIEKYGSLIIHPLIGQYKKNEYKDSVIIKLNKLASKIYNNKNVFVLPFYSYPRYGGPREAALHAIVRKNYGCTHIWIGRDHAGYKKNFSLYESQAYCTKNEKKLGIKIVAMKEPYYCYKCKKITNNCNKSIHKKIQISGSKIRKLIIEERKIPKSLMDTKISKNLNKKSLL